MIPRPLPLDNPYVREPYRLFEAVAGRMYDLKAQEDQMARPRRSTLAKPRLRTRVQERYAEYHDLRENLERLERSRDFDDDEREALGACYGNSKALVGLKAAILDAQPGACGVKCPYCCITTIGEEWDHYLPKKDGAYPEFSVFPGNLVPICGRCNKLKNEDVLTEGERIFIHFYYDRFDPAICLLEATIHMEPGPGGALPRVNYQIVPAASASAFGRLYVRHCSRLELLGRYRDESREYIHAIPADLRRSERRGPAEKIAEVFDELSANYGSRLGINHPKAAIYRAAARSQEFIEFCRLPP